MAMSNAEKASRARNKPMVKMNREQLEGVMIVADRIREESDAIRARLGLEPVTDSVPMQQARARLRELVAKDAGKRKPSRAPAGVVPSPGSSRDLLTVDALESWRRKHEREGEEIRAAAVAMFRDRVAGATRIGEALGVKRQRVYQLADAA